jgi:hypothetical protein
MRKFLGIATLALIAGAALPALAQAVQTPQGGPDRPALKCGDYKHNSDGSWSPAHEVNIVFPDGTSLTVAPNTVFSATGSWMGMPFGQLLNDQCGGK